MIKQWIYYALALLSTERWMVIAKISPRQENILSPIIDPALDAVGKWIVGPAVNGVVTGVGAIKGAAGDGINTINHGASNSDRPNPSSLLKPATGRSQEQAPYRIELDRESPSRAPAKKHECDLAHKPNNKNPSNCQN